MCDLINVICDISVVDIHIKLIFSLIFDIYLGNIYDIYLFDIYSNLIYIRIFHIYSNILYIFVYIHSNTNIFKWVGPRNSKKLAVTDNIDKHACTCFRQKYCVTFIRLRKYDNRMCIMHPACQFFDLVKDWLNFLIFSKFLISEISNSPLQW